MQKSKILLAVALFAGMILSGFQCSSTELTSARLYIQQKNFDKAIVVLKKDVANNPKSDEGWFLLGHTYGEVDDIESMIMSYDKSLAISSKFEKEINNSENFYWTNSFNSGVNLFQRANNTADEDSAKIFYDKSIDAFETAAKIQPDSADAYKNMAFVYMRSGRNELAIEPLQQLVDLKKELDGYRYLGEIYFTIGTSKSAEFSMSGNAIDSIEAAEYYDRAIFILEEGVAIYPTDGELTRILNSSYIETGRISEALESSKVLVEAKPDNEIYRYNYGVILLQTNDFPAAEEQFLKALEIDSDYENAAYNLGLTYVKWGSQLKEREEETEVYTDEDMEKYRQALPYLELIVESDAENAEIWELLGKVYGILSMQEEAMDAFNKADQLR
ncbi:MAG: tetratricopeptide repeat protein [Bacteroidetes bacterium]|nr:tetratricopeptide repeat protein [Bacteroidota bacterium]MCH8032156.1 tetratricopeptide repeat protein [Bacteroidota bacterium]